MAGNPDSPRSPCSALDAWARRSSARLLAAGYEVAVWNRSPGPLAAAADAGQCRKAPLPTRSETAEQC